MLTLVHLYFFPAGENKQRRVFDVDVSLILSNILCCALYRKENASILNFKCLIRLVKTTVEKNQVIYVYTYSNAEMGKSAIFRLKSSQVIF